MSAEVIGNWRTVKGKDMTICYFYPNGHKDYIVVRLIFDNKILDIQQDSVKVFNVATRTTTEEFFDREHYKILMSKKRNKCLRLCDSLYDLLN